MAIVSQYQLTKVGLAMHFYSTQVVGSEELMRVWRGLVVGTCWKLVVRKDHCYFGWTYPFLLSHLVQQQLWFKLHQATLDMNQF
jgi:hypothetical protein